MPEDRCVTCMGTGKIKRLLMSQGVIANLDKLAKIIPNEPIPIRDEGCPDCFGTGLRIGIREAK